MCGINTFLLPNTFTGFLSIVSYPFDWSLNLEAFNSFSAFWATCWELLLFGKQKHRLVEKFLHKLATSCYTVIIWCSSKSGDILGIKLTHILFFIPSMHIHPWIYISCTIHGKLILSSTRSFDKRATEICSFYFHRDEYKK